MIACLSPNGQNSTELDAPPDELLIGSSGGVVRLRRDGAGGAWREDGRYLDGMHIGALINAPGGRLLAGCHHGGGVFRSVDRGETWEQVGQDINATEVFSLAVLDTPTGPAILAGTEPVKLYRSDDFGDSWHEEPAITTLPNAVNWTFPAPPHIPHLKAMTINPGAPQSLFACVEQGALLRTDDAGKSWVDLDMMWRPDDGAYRDAHRMIVAPWNPRLLIFASGIYVYRSTDGGESWTADKEIPQYTGYPDALIVSPSDRTIYVGGPRDVPLGWLQGSPRAVILRSDDEGQNWTPVSRNLHIGPRANIEGLAIASYPGGCMLIAGDTDGGIFVSEDRAETWEQIARTDGISKGAHYKLAQFSAKLPAILRPAATLVFSKMTNFTAKRARARRRAEFARRPQGQSPAASSLPTGAAAR